MDLPLFHRELDDLLRADLGELGHVGLGRVVQVHGDDLHDVVRRPSQPNGDLCRVRAFRGIFFRKYGRFRGTYMDSPNFWKLWSSAG